MALPSVGPALVPSLPIWRRRAGAALLSILLVVLAMVFYGRLFSRTGSVELRIADTGAEVFIDGKRINGSSESGSIKIDLPPGDHEITATKDGFKPFTKRFTVEVNEIDQVYVFLEPIKFQNLPPRPPPKGRKIP